MDWWMMDKSKSPVKDCLQLKEVIKLGWKDGLVDGRMGKS